MLETAETIGKVLRRRAGNGIPAQISMEPHNDTYRCVSIKKMVSRKFSTSISLNYLIHVISSSAS